MAAVVITADNVRIEDCESGTGFTNIGGGAGGAAEAPFAYQGSLLFNRKVTSSTGSGFQYVPTNDGGTTTDMTATRRRTWMVKCMVSDYGGLDATDGVLVRIGSSSANYYAYVLAGTDSPAANFAAYRDIGGLLVVPVDPNENATYNDTAKDSGSPTLTAVDYFALVAAFTTPSAKNENVGLDAIDVGSGLYLVGGDGADPDGVWQDFVDHDGNTVGNRYGYARNADGGGILAFGEWRIGTNNDSTGTATVFTDDTAVITWLDHLAGAGFSRVSVDLQASGTIVNDGSLHIGAGDTTNVDSRPDYIVTGLDGEFNFTGTLRNFRNVELSPAATIEAGASIECADMIQSTAILTGCTIRTTSATSIATILNPSFPSMDDVAFVQAGAGHAVRITAAGTYSFDNLRFSGYGADASDSAAIDVTASSGTVTINILNGGNTPTVKTAGATVVVNNSVSVEVSAVDGSTGSAVENARVLLYAAAGGDLPAEDAVTGDSQNTTATVTHTAHGLSTGDQVIISGITNQVAAMGIHTITVTGVNTYTYPIADVGGIGISWLGSPTSTFVILSGLTNASGLISDSGFNFTNNQPVVGRVRKGTTSPLYKTQPISGTITSGGFSTTAPLVSDE